MTASPHTQHIPVQGDTNTGYATLAPALLADLPGGVAGATPLLPPHHPANVSDDSPVVRWTLRLEQARPIEEDAV